MNIKAQIEKDLVATFEKLGFDKGLAVVSISGVDICDYQCNASFQLGKALGCKPIEVATKIAANFLSEVAVAEAVPPAFVNFRIKDSALVEIAKNTLKSGQLPILKQEPRVVFFDYGGANIAKELHVGHLRSPMIGEALKRTFSALGHKTFADTFLGDWGLQIGLVIAEMELNNTDVDGISLNMLNEFYPRASKRKDTDAAFRARAEQITLDMQQLKQPYFDISKKIRDVSVAKIKENYETLNCTFDTFNGEFHAQQHIPVVLEKLKAKGAYMNDGCLIMDVKVDSDTGPMPPILLQKSNGGELYTTTDVATAYYRYLDYKPDEFIHVVDSRQELHFNQVFRCVAKGELVPPNTKFTHVSYGTMNGTDGKPFKTRSGDTIKFEDVINIVTEAAEKRLRENSVNNDSALARKIGIAALKFADLSNNVRKDYVFDLDKFTSFEGKTGPYILYTIARINSLLNKVKDKPAISKIDSTSRGIIIKLIKLADAYPVAAANYTLNGIVDAAFALAVEFNSFYADYNISREADAEKRAHALALCVLTRLALTQAMDTLAIEIVEEM
jgi:arginyl-tRNA synthetase